MEKIKKKYRALIILGNGFDLACGYRTKFEHFYQETMKTNSEFKDHNFFIQLIRETFYLDENSKEMQKLLKVSSKENWMDIELLLNHFLLGDTFKYVELAFAQASHNRGYNFTPLYPGRVFYNWISLSSSNLSKGLNSFLMSHLKAFEDKLCLYLKNDAQVSGYDDSKVNILFHQLTEDVVDGKVINFNYTIPWDERGKEKFPICYVHGSIYDKTAIIGIDPTINKKEVLDIGENKKFTKTFRKIGLNCEQNKFEKVLEEGIDKIIFYGHSLGEQDYSYFQSIFDFYDLYNNSNIVLEFCYSEYDKNKSERDVLIERIYKLLNLYGNTLDNKEHGKNLLHKLLLENRIKLNKIVMPEEIIESYKQMQSNKNSSVK